VQAGANVSPLALVGLTTQVVGAALISLLFVLLQKHAARHRPFRLWCAAWLALTVALVALVPWIHAESALGSWPPASFSLPWWGLAVYQLGKLVYLLLLLLGLLVFTHGIDWRRWLHVGLPAALLAAGVSLLTPGGLDAALAVQAPLVVAVSATGALLLAGMPHLRRSLGTRVTAAALALLAALWIANVLRFWRPEAGRGTTALRQLSEVASSLGVFGDVVLQILLGLGMVVILFESIMREAAAAHDELAISHRHLERQAFLDPLTATYNRSAFAAGHGLGLATATIGVVAVFDLDDFKAVNDTHGHAAGDLVLRHFAETARGLLRASDSLYRWGGDEFVAVLPGAVLADVVARLTAALDHGAPVRLETGAVVPLRVSLGAASFTSGATLDAAIAAADERMLAAKRQRHASRSAA
jgi:diguanylate cyclase (GGDEF)-like protein